MVMIQKLIECFACIFQGMRTVLSARWKDKVQHFVINEKDGKYFIDKEKFRTILELITFYSTEQKSVTEQTEAILITPIPKQEWEFKHDWVAVKVSKASEVTKKIIAEICKEARIMRRYRHPNVVRFYGVAVEHVRIQQQS
ncbi:unnamed protein product [Cylicostephanus goldi]|uniref:Non-specific protein-tyrosine kinase n=1 Tax=Cylicostephanus goldi TaxID=71465 RepID=A0A3P6RLK8_CYLGO|nr:unnamed protein product [Cylicostephanus goldi]